MPDAGSHRCGYVSAGRTRPDDERIALVDGELSYASSSVPAGPAVGRAGLLLQRGGGDQSFLGPPIGGLPRPPRPPRAVDIPRPWVWAATAACTPQQWA